MEEKPIVISADIAEEAPETIESDAWIEYQFTLRTPCPADVAQVISTHPDDLPPDIENPSRIRKDIESAIWDYLAENKISWCWFQTITADEISPTTAMVLARVYTP